MHLKTGVLLINLGTPKSSHPKDIRKYLKAFLGDPRVIDLPFWLRKFLLHIFILPFRPRQTAKAYAAIWDSQRGAPLLFHSLAFAKKLQEMLGNAYIVEMAMRYGTPSIESALRRLEAQCQKLIIFPLFPQYASSAGGSAIEAVLRLMSSRNYFSDYIILGAFYKAPFYIKAQSHLLKDALEKSFFEAIIFSYHSLPWRHIKKMQSDCQSTCLQNLPCPAINENNYRCYRAQCYETTRAILQAVPFDGIVKVAFQSRLGNTPWVGPSLEEVMDGLKRKGVKRVCVLCPSFVADCLETLEEVGMRGREYWQDLGGTHYTVLSCLNASLPWVEGVAQKLVQMNQCGFAEGLTSSSDDVHEVY